MFDQAKIEAEKDLVLAIQNKRIDSETDSLSIKFNRLPFAFTKFSCRGHPRIEEVRSFSSVPRRRPVKTVLCEAEITFALHPRQRKANEFLVKLINLLKCFRIEGQGECVFKFLGNPLEETDVVDLYNRVLNTDLKYTLRLAKAKKFFDEGRHSLDTRFWILRFSAAGCVKNNEEGQRKLNLVKRNSQRFFKELENLVDECQKRVKNDFC